MEKVLKYYPGIKGNSWGPLKKRMKQTDKMPINSVEDLKEQIERYSEIYTLMEDSTMLVGADFMRFGNFKSIMKAGWHLLRVTLPGIMAYNKRKTLIKNSPMFESLAIEEPKLKLLLDKDERIPLEPGLMIKEYYHVMKFSSNYGKMQANFDGKKQSYYRLSKYLGETDRDLRYRAWMEQSKLLSARSNTYNKIFNKMLKIRIKRAKRSGYDNVRDYFHEQKGRFDYTPADIFKFHDAIEEKVVPIVKKINEHRVAKLGIDTLRPWDKTVSLYGEPLKPYSTESELLEKVNRIYAKIDPEFDSVFKYMRENGFIDSENRRGKMPGAMSIPLMMHRCGFIVIRSVLQETWILWLMKAGIPFHYITYPSAVCDVSRVHESANGALRKSVR